MNRFLDLPLIQRILIVAIVCAACGGASYYFIILPASQQITRENIKYENTMKEYATLRTYDTPEFTAEMDRQKAENIRLKAAYATMLPTADQVPELIESIKRQADEAGLAMTILDADKRVQDGPGYRGISFDVEMVGTYHQTVSFLAGLAGTSKRIINAVDLHVQPAPTDQLQRTAGDVGLLRVLTEREAARGLTPNEKYAKTVLLFDDIARRRLMKVNFTAVAYVYTGTAAPAAHQ